MTPELDVNFDETPDSIPPIPAGTHLCEVVGVPKLEQSKKGNSMNLIVELKLVHDDVRFNGRLIRDYINKGTNPELDLRADIKTKHLFASAGVAVAKGTKPATEELAGKRVKAVLTPRTYKDDSGNEQQGTNVKDYVAA